MRSAGSPHRFAWLELESGCQIVLMEKSAGKAFAKALAAVKAQAARRIDGDDDTFS